ncbi:C1QL [Mytilus coruscus]|uniref:C1QL n=1 Tax=Mytilus coruscus TaxID=42192 RepID=A0A6J8DQL0_MYTCO|nr:C1QL [Mytilus coruscus]
MKQKLDSTIEENHLLRERVDVQSKDIKALIGKMKVVLETNAHLTERLDTVSEENRDMKNILITLLEYKDADVNVSNNNEQNENKMVSFSSVNEPVLFREDEKNKHANTQGGKILSTKHMKGKRLLLNSLTTESPVISRVAFSAKLIGGHIQLGQHQTVGYNTVYTNIGNAYDSRFNHFIVPSKGVYLLSITGMNVSGQHVYLEMVKNGNQIAIVYCGDSGNNMGSQTIAEVLEKGDVVWVRDAYDGYETINGNDGYNTFTGVLLFAI